MLVGSIDAPSVPVGPINKLVEHGHGKGINGCAYDDFSIGPRKMRSLNLLSNGRTKSSLPVYIYISISIYIYIDISIYIY